MVLFSVLLAACQPAPSSPGDTGPLTVGGWTPEEGVLLASLSPLPPVPPDPTNAWADDEDAARFGRTLFFDPRLSSTGTVSCATCHDPALGFSDGLALSEGIGTTPRHAPHLWNVGNHRWFTWDGHCDSLWCQAVGPLEADAEMDSSRLALAHTLSDNPDLREAYEAVFGALPEVGHLPEQGRPVADDSDHPDALAWATLTAAEQDAVTGVTVRIAKALAAFQRRLRTRPTRVDAYVEAFVARDEDAMAAALSSEEEAGLRHFLTDGQCHLCHGGALYSNREFASVGLGPRAWLDLEDLGRYTGITLLQDGEFNAASPWSDDPSGEAAQRIDRLNQTTEQLGLFKVPGLRNIAASPPYMHGGHFQTLTEVVEHYVRLEEEVLVGHLDDFMEPLPWDDADVAEVVAFLEALSSPPEDPAVLSAP